MHHLISILGLGLAAMMNPWCGALLASSSPAPLAAVVSDPATGTDPAFARELAAQVQSAGYAIRSIDFVALSHTNELVAARIDLLVLPDARALPVEAAGSIAAFLQAGGDLLALGLPAWNSPRYRVNQGWISQADYQKALADQRPAHWIADFDPEDLSRWTRSANQRESPASAELESGDQGRALHVVVQHLTGWDTLASPALTQPFPPGDSLTCFRAKGAPQTGQMIVEWTERDGSRWIATVNLTTEWRSYALPIEAFHAWEPPRGRGGPGDHLHPDQAARFSVGLAFSHSPIKAGRHEYWLDDLGTAPNPCGEAVGSSEGNIPRLETVSPAYQFYSIGGPVRLSAPPEWAGLTVARPDPPVALQAMQPRPRGAGYNQERPWRWQPLLEAHAAGGDYRGAIATLLVQTQRPFRGGLWAAFTPADPAFYRQPALQQVLRETLTRLRRGLFLHEGGSEFFTGFAPRQGHEPQRGECIR